jgi:hypothetical protein
LLEGDAAGVVRNEWVVNKILIWLPLPSTYLLRMWLANRIDLKHPIGSSFLNSSAVAEVKCEARYWSKYAWVGKILNFSLYQESCMHVLIIHALLAALASC